MKRYDWQIIYLVLSNSILRKMFALLNGIGINKIPVILVLFYFHHRHIWIAVVS